MPPRGIGGKFAEVPKEEELDLRKPSPKRQTHQELIPIEEISTEDLIDPALNPEEALIAKEERRLSGEDSEEEAQHEHTDKMRQAGQLRDQLKERDDPRVAEYHADQESYEPEGISHRAYTVDTGEDSRTPAQAGGTPRAIDNEVTTKEKAIYDSGYRSYNERARYIKNRYDTKTGKVIGQIPVPGRHGRENPGKHEKGGESIRFWRKLRENLFGDKEAAD